MGWRGCRNNNNVALNGAYGLNAPPRNNLFSYQLGVITLEDLLERLLGVDIIDEKDTTVSMRRLAKMMTRRKERMMVKNVPDESLDRSHDKSKSNGNAD